MTCIFCEIVRGNAPAFKVHEDDHTLTFMDIFPVSRGHALIIPKDHFENLFEANEESLARIVTRSLALAKAIRRVIAPDGLGVYQLNGAAAGQTVFHYHMHLIPRHEGGRLDLHTRVRGKDADLEAVSREIAAALEAG